MIYFTADQHFGHQNIIRYCSRPFSDVESMDKTIIDNWNKIVSVHDLVFVVGDFAWNNDLYYTDKLNGNIALIRGNHDRSKAFDSLTVVCNGTYIFLNHLPYFNNKPDENVEIVLCGHVHNLWKSKLYQDIPMINVGVDVWGFKPVALETLLIEANKIKKEVN